MFTLLPKQSNRQGGVRAVDVPARSLDLARPGVAPPLLFLSMPFSSRLWTATLSCHGVTHTSLRTMTSTAGLDVHSLLSELQHRFSINHCLVPWCITYIAHWELSYSSYINSILIVLFFWPFWLSCCRKPSRMLWLMKTEWSNDFDLILCCLCIYIYIVYHMRVCSVCDWCTVVIFLLNITNSSADRKENWQDGLNWTIWYVECVSASLGLCTRVLKSSKLSSFWSTQYMLCIVCVCVVFGAINAVLNTLSVSISESN